MNMPKDVWDAVENFTDPSYVKSYIDAGERQILRREGKTLLMLAAEKNSNPDILKVLVSAGAKMELKDKEGKTALLYALDNSSNPQMAETLIALGANASVVDNEGNGALHRENLNPELIQLLVDAGADVNAKNNDGVPPLMCCDDPDSMQVLLEAGADANATDNDGYTPLMNLLSTYLDEDSYQEDLEKRLRLMNLLITKGNANVGLSTRWGETALSFALTYCGDLQVIQILIDAGASINDINEDGKTALMSSQFPEATQFLLDSGLDVNAVDKEGMTALMYSNNSENTQVLIDAGADVNAKDNDGQTALMQAGDGDNARTLIDFGADINAKDNDGMNALMLCNYVDCAQVLLDAGIDVNAVDDRGRNALMCVIDEEAQEIEELVQLLIDSGIDINAKDFEGNTALMYVAQQSEEHYDCVSVIKLLLDSGADFDAQNNNGTTALFYAFANEDYPVKVNELLAAKGETGLDFGNINWVSLLMFVTAFGKSPRSLRDLADTVFKFKESDHHYPFEERAMCLAAENLNCAQEMVNALIEGGINVDQTGDNSETALMDIAINGENPEALKVLINAGANLEATNSIGRTALYCASLNATCARKMMETLISAGADIEHRRGDSVQTVLMDIARFGGNHDALKVLIDAGANLEAVDSKGRTALYAAAYNKTDVHVMMETLIKARANIEHRDSYGDTLLMHIASECPTPEALEVLISAGADLDSEDNIGRTALFHASFNDTCARTMMETLIRAGADIEHRDNEGCTVLMAIATYGTNPDALTVLKEAGANLNGDYNGMAALMLASLNTHHARAMMETLIRAGADIEHRYDNGPNRGVTPLMFIALAGTNPDALKVLIEAGADLHAKDYNGRDSIVYAKANDTHSAEMMSVLRNYRPTGPAKWLTQSVEQYPVQTISPAESGRQQYENSFQSGSSYSLSEKTRKARSVIWYYAVANGGIGFAPIPMSDWPLMVAAEITMTIHIYTKFGYKLSKEDAGKIFQDVFIKLGGPYLGLTIAGKTVSSLLKIIPGVGTAVGGVINAGVSATITKIYGEFVIKCASEGLSYSSLYTMSEEKVGTLIGQAKTVAEALDYNNYKTGEKFD